MMTGITSPPSLTTLYTTGATLLSIARSSGVDIELLANLWRNSHAPSCEMLNRPMAAVFAPRSWRNVLHGGLKPCSASVTKSGDSCGACSNAAAFSYVDTAINRSQQLLISTE